MVQLVKRGWCKYTHVLFVVRKKIFLHLHHYRLPFGLCKASIMNKIHFIVPYVCICFSSLRRGSGSQTRSIRANQKRKNKTKQNTQKRFTHDQHFSCGNSDNDNETDKNNIMSKKKNTENRCKQCDRDAPNAHHTHTRSRTHAPHTRYYTKTTDVTRSERNNKQRTHKRGNGTRTTD